MSNELTLMGNELVLPILPGGKAVEIVNAPLRLIAPALRVAARCRVELDELQKKRDSIRHTNEMILREHDKVYPVTGIDCHGSKVYGSARSTEASHAFNALVHLEEAKLTREMLLPHFVEVQQAHGLLDAIYSGGQNIDVTTALNMISVLHRVLKKTKDNVSLFSFVSLFDPDIDSLGPSLNLWKEVPRHPIVVALGIHLLFHKQIFAPAPAELCDACRTGAERLKSRYQDSTNWLHTLSMADVKLYEEDRDAWARIYSTGLVSAPVLGWYLGHEHSGERMNARDAAIRKMRMPQSVK